LMSFATDLTVAFGLASCLPELFLLALARLLLLVMT